VSDRAEAVLAGPALEPSQVDVRPEVQSRVAPRLPGHLAGRQVEDVVILRVLVSPSGHATDARVLRTSKVDASLDDAAIEAVRQWRFTPARKGGRAVSCWFSVGVPMRGE
jgi:protein TonB